MSSTVFFERCCTQRFPSISLRISNLRRRSLTDFDISTGPTLEIEPNPDGTYLPSSYKLPPGRLGTLQRSRPIRKEDEYEV